MNRDLLIIFLQILVTYLHLLKLTAHHMKLLLLNIDRLFVSLLQDLHFDNLMQSFIFNSDRFSAHPGVFTHKIDFLNGYGLVGLELGHRGCFQL